MATTSIHVLDYGFESFERSFLYKRIVWKDGDRDRVGEIVLVASYGLLVVNASDGERVAVDLE
jgi:hypothetical protein